MKGIVINPFRDKYHFNTEYKKGDVVEFDKVRMEDLFSRNLCKKFEEQEETPAPSTNEEGVNEMVKEEDTPSIDEAKEKSEQEASEKIAKATRRKRTI